MGAGQGSGLWSRTDSVCLHGEEEKVGTSRADREGKALLGAATPGKGQSQVVWAATGWERRSGQAGRWKG